MLKFVQSQKQTFGQNSNKNHTKTREEMQTEYVEDNRRCLSAELKKTSETLSFSKIKTGLKMLSCACVIDIFLRFHSRRTECSTMSSQGFKNLPVKEVKDRLLCCSLCKALAENLPAGPPQGFTATGHGPPPIFLCRGFLQSCCRRGGLPW